MPCCATTSAGLREPRQQLLLLLRLRLRLRPRPRPCAAPVTVTSTTTSNGNPIRGSPQGPVELSAHTQWQSGRQPHGIDTATSTVWIHIAPGESCTTSRAGQDRQRGNATLVPCASNATGHFPACCCSSCHLTRCHSSRLISSHLVSFDSLLSHGATYIHTYIHTVFEHAGSSCLFQVPTAEALDVIRPFYNSTAPCSICAPQPLTLLQRPPCPTRLIGWRRLVGHISRANTTNRSCRCV